MKHWVICICACIGCIAVWSSKVCAGTTGGILGFATDAEFHPLAHVRISAVSPSERATTVTLASGFYSLNGLPLDVYTITFSKDGYLTRIVANVSTIQDQSIRVNVQLEPEYKTLARISVRSSTSLVQPTVTADTYVLNQQRLADINGTPQDLQGFFNGTSALPGLTPDPFGIPKIRGGAINDIGFQLDGVDEVDPVFGFAMNVQSLNGVHSVQLLTGGYDVSEGNTNSGVINEVIKRGTYPAQGQMTARTNGPLYGHELSFDFGTATPNDNFSYYFSFGGRRDAFADGNGPLFLDNNSSVALNDSVVNLFYHFGQGDKSELQFLANTSGQTIFAYNLVDVAKAPYAANNGNVQAAFDPFGLCRASLAPPFPACNTAVLESSYLPLFPGQVTEKQNIGAPDNFTTNSVIEKISFKRRLTSSSFVQARIMRTTANEVLSFPYGGGSFRDNYSDLQTTGMGQGIDYVNQLNSKHEIGFGAEGFYYANRGFGGNPSVLPFFEPLEALGCAAAANALGAQQAGGCYIAPFNAALNAAGLGLNLPIDPSHAPLRRYALGYGYITDPVYRWNAYAKDRWQPNERLTMTVGLRWDKEWIPIPKNAAALNTTYYVDDSRPAGCGAPPAGPCDIVTQPGQPIGSDVTQPHQLSPRLAASYEMTPLDVVRFSYGKNIEFVQLSGIEITAPPSPALEQCTISSGCFTPLPGYGVTNHVTNLYEQVVLDLTTHVNAQYTPVLPQTAANMDFSYEHDFGKGVQLRVTPYYRKGTNYAVNYAPLLFTLKSGTPIFGTPRTINGGINKNTGVELVLQRDAQFGLSGLFDVTYDNTLANYDGDGGPTGVNAASLAAGHFYHTIWVAPLNGLLNLRYNSPKGFYAGMTAFYEPGFRYGVGKKTFVFAPNGAPVEVLNTDLVSGAAGAYYLTNPSNPGTEFAPNIVASRGTPEGDDPGTLFGAPIAAVNLTISHRLWKTSNEAEVGVRVANLFSSYSAVGGPPNPYYGFSGFGNHGLPSGVNPNACARGQTFGCEPFQYNYSALPYENEPGGPLTTYTLFCSIKY